MSETPNLCIDIFTQISNVLGNLQRIAADPSNTMNQGGGFDIETSETLSSTGQEPTALLTWLFIAILFIFLMLGNRGQEPEDLKANIRRQNFDYDNDNDRNGID